MIFTIVRTPRTLMNGKKPKEIPPVLTAVRSTESQLHTIVAMCDAYVDFLTPGGSTNAGMTIFRINDTELTLETYRLKQEQLLTQITADRLSEDYVNKLVYGPMQAAIDFATADLKLAKKQVAQVHLEKRLGVIDTWMEEVQETVALVEEKTILLERASADLIQRQIEIDGQRRRLKAEQDDLKQRLEMDDHISAMHQYVMPAKGTVEFKTYNGAFVKKKDPICSIHFDAPFS